MTVRIVPIQNIPDQEFYIALDGVDYKIHIYTRYRNMYMDLSREDKVLFNGRICLNDVDMVQFAYLKFNGQLKFIDTQGVDDPYYAGFGERWFLTYVQ